MTRQNQILGIVAIVLVIIIGAFVFWPEAVEQPTEPIATTEGGDTDATAPTTDEQPGAEGETGTDTEGSAN
jgi:hypothetical protein